MDCEKFEAAMMDELYGELDELTSAACKRHLAGCARCAALFEGLRATRKAVALPEIVVPAGLEERILAATREAAKVVPIQRPLARMISLAGSWAMRPQSAMAAVFLVMIGTSVLLLTGKASRAPASASVTVTEQGSPAPEPVAAAAATAAPAASAPAYVAPQGLDKIQAQSAVAAASAVTRPDAPRDESAARAKSAPAKDDEAPLGATNGFASGAGSRGGAGADGDLGRDSLAEERKSASPISAAIQSYQAGRYDEAARAFDALAPGDPTADLWAARAIRESKGCRAALARFDRVAQRAAGKPVAWDALLEGALCYRATSDFASARTRLTALLGVDSHRDRAKAELDRLNQMQPAQGAAGPAAVRAAPASKAAAPAAPAAAPAPARPQATQSDQGM